MMAFNGIMLGKIRHDLKESPATHEYKATNNFLEFKVEKILQKRARLGKTEYQIRWEGFGHIDGENTWESKDDVLLAVPEILSAFEENWKKTFDQCLASGLTTKPELFKLPYLSRLATSSIDIWPSSLAGEISNSGDQESMVARRRISMFGHLNGENPFLNASKDGELVEGQQPKFAISQTHITQGNSVELNKKLIREVSKPTKLRNRKKSKLPVRLLSVIVTPKKPEVSPKSGSPTEDSPPNTPSPKQVRKRRGKRASAERTPPLYCEKSKPIKRQVPTRVKRQRKKGQ